MFELRRDAITSLTAYPQFQPAHQPGACIQRAWPAALCIDRRRLWSFVIRCHFLFVVGWHRSSMLLVAVRRSLSFVVDCWSSFVGLGLGLASMFQKHNPAPSLRVLFPPPKQHVLEFDSEGLSCS